jgi:large conductance mechanosensitive channel
MLKGFKDFIFRGNVVDLAVGVVIGGAFGAIVTALVKDLITPLIAFLVGKPDFSAIDFYLGTTKFPIGDFINAVVGFILVAAAIYFFVVIPMSHLMKPPAATTKPCPECLSDIPIGARKCAHCASVIA